MLWAELWAATTPVTRGELEHGLPWYFTAALVIAWLVVVVAVFAILRFRLRAWLSRRSERRRAKRGALPPAHGTDVELY